MRWVAFMPLRANSKSIPDKNIRRIAGRPLFAWSLEQAIASQCFDEIYVATDSARIRKIVLDEFPASVTVLERSAETCTDTASTESAMLEFQRQVSFDVIALIQATSPLTHANDFRAAQHQFVTDNLDSLLTAVPSKRFFWTKSGAPINYEPAKRPRRQDFEGWLMENGAFYLTRAKLLQETGSRLGGCIGIHEMNAETAIEIDDETDWIVVEQLLLRQISSRLGVSQIKAFVLDVDGTLTDGGMYYGPAGEALKKFNTRDAHGLQLLRENGVKVCVFSSEDSPAVAARMKKLKIDEYYPGIKNKLAVLENRIKSWGISLQEIAYMGDDLCDLDCLGRVGAAICPADAVPEILQRAHYICTRPAGYGAVREACDLILRIKPGAAALS
ncbi:N-acylneuraminate cytidylyltransferase [Nitrosomonas communis]|uniref:N-acylneuraminate cytidylyltransferase n=1 Tax=Nitrosomonas communis TaxID=44574 RepID=UPI0026EE22CC|nr:N-acylneuraminate cytidylyltransferase [Nitrosomonas communis]MCO6427431.1 N-acylneuraminate cytidylyltransferase [Nitrosomonas communis]